MGLYEKLVGLEEPKIGVHGFSAALRDWQDGAATRQNVIDSYALSVADEADLDWLKAQYVAKTDKKEFIGTMQDVLILGEERRLGYDTKSNFTARIIGLS